MRWRPGYAGAAESGAGPPGRLAGRADRTRLLGRAKARERSPTTPLARTPGVHRTLGAPHSRAPACRADGTDRRRPAVLDPMHSAEDKYTASEGLRQHVHISMDRHVRAENYGATLWLCTETSSLSAQSSTVYIGGDRVGVCRARTQRHPVEGLPRDPASQTRPVSRPLASTPRALCGRLLRRARGPTAARLTTASTTRLVRRREDLTGRPHQRGRLLRARHLLRGRRDGATLFAEATASATTTARFRTRRPHSARAATACAPPAEEQENGATFIADHSVGNPSCRTSRTPLPGLPLDQGHDSSSYEYGRLTATAATHAARATAPPPSATTDLTQDCQRSVAARPDLCA